MEFPELPMDLGAAVIRWPVDRVRVTPHGGYRYDRSAWKPGGKIHLGVDLGAKRGTKVYAPESGTVVAVWLDDNTKPWSRYGPAGLCIKGDSGVYHVLAHLLASNRAPASIAIGSRVAIGDVVGYVSGLNHVHWEPRRAMMWKRGQKHEDIVLDPFEVATVPPSEAVIVPLPLVRKRDSAGFALVVATVAALAWWSR